MKNSLYLCLLAVVLVGLAGSTIANIVPTSSKGRFDNFKMYRVQVNDEKQLKDLTKLGDALPVFYLNEIQGSGRSYDIVIDPISQPILEKTLEYNGLGYDILSENLEDTLARRETAPTNSTMEWTKYHTLSDIYTWLDDLIWNNRSFVTPYTLGYSYEGRPIRAIKISRKPGNKAIFIEANIHAIEWISSAAGTCFINKLLTSQDGELVNLLNNYDWFFVPVLNPDGFAYTHDVQPLWRKNRRPNGFLNSLSICRGVDLNRNFNSHWGEAGLGVTIACGPSYGGSEPDSEPEVKVLEKFLKGLPNGYIRIYLALHSFGQYLLLPYGYTNTEFPPNYDQMMRISKGFADKAIDKYGTNYTYGASGVLSYPVSGSAKDWAYEVLNIPYTATLELRDKGRYGFFLPANQIIETCEEITDGFVGLISTAQSEGLFD